MSIQSSINQGISLATLIATQTPWYKQQSEIHKQSQKVKGLEKMEATSGTGDDKDVLLSGEEGTRLAEERETLARMKYEARPTKGRRKAYIESVGKTKEAEQEQDEIESMYGESEPYDPKKDPYATMYGAKARAQQEMSARQQVEQDSIDRARTSIEGLPPTMENISLMARGALGEATMDNISDMAREALGKGEDK